MARSLTRTASTHKVATTAVAAGLLVGGAFTAAVVGGDPPSSDALPATVERVVDGDTLVVRVDGARHRVRLLNVDAPESVRPDHPVECLGPEAAAYLADRLPPGTTVHLHFDQERTDPYDRLLAGVVHDGALVNADVVRAGMAVTVLFGDNDRFYDDVLAAEREAEAAGVGLHASSAGCPGGG